MPLYHDAERLIRANLDVIKNGRKAQAVIIGRLTDKQLTALNEERKRRNLPSMVAEVVFIGRHIYESRILQDGYTIDDVVKQIACAMAENSAFHANPKMNALVCQTERGDGYGNRVRDTAVFECTARYPRPELYSVIPKGDAVKPQKR